MLSRWTVEGIALGQDFAEVVARRGAPAQTSPFPSEAAESGIGVAMIHTFKHDFKRRPGPWRPFQGLGVGVDSDQKVVFVRNGILLEADGQSVGGLGDEIEFIHQRLGEPDEIPSGPPGEPDDRTMEFHTWYRSEQVLTVEFSSGLAMSFDLERDGARC